MTRKKGSTIDGRTSSLKGQRPQQALRKSPVSQRGSDLEKRYQKLQESMQEAVAQRQRAEEALDQERNLFNILMENVPDYIYFKDRESRFIRTSKAHAKLFGLSDPSQVAGKTDFDFFAIDHAQPAFDDEQEVIRTGRSVIGKEEKETWPDGRVTWASTTKVPFHDKAGDVIGTLGISRDITQKKQAEAEVEIMHKRLLDASRRAGMAEVATGVLHNVGNVLNSVNVSATLISEKVRNLKISGLVKAAELMKQHAEDLGDFFTNDEKGRRLPEYFKLLADQLEAEQAVIRGETQSLIQNINHIKDIVAIQQTYARVSGVVETVAVAELVEDAVRMNSGTFTRHDINVVRDYSNVPKITVDKIKVLQILLNLLRNAKYACDESVREDKQLIIRIKMSGENRVQIIVEDNGVGIAPENLTRVFTHGFTTRKDGHGFGLHSGAIAAKELGGTLTAHSDGLRQGARFTLELPLQPKEGGA